MVIKLALGSYIGRNARVMGLAILQGRSAEGHLVVRWPWAML